MTEEPATEPQVASSAPTRSRAEHLQWCKDRAKGFLPGDPEQACTRMMSDLKQHEELASYIGINFLFQHMMLPGWLGDAEKVGRFIDGFN